MNITWLRTFLIAAEYENFYKTSEVLFLSQPTVTVHIRKLEKELGIPLFMKKGRNVRLTSYGREFLKHAQAIMANMDEGIDHIEKLRQGYNKTLTIAVSPLIASTYLPFWMKQFLKTNSHVEIDVHVLESHLIAEEVDKGKADIGLSRQESRRSDLICEKIYEEPVKIVAPYALDKFPLASSVTLEEIINTYVLLTHNHPGYWDPVLLELKNAYRQVRTMKVSQVSITKRFIEEGIGFSILPHSTLTRELAEQRIREVTSSTITLPLAATYYIQKFETYITNRFIKTLKQLI
ncbi:LysR family transcriptional regulator [Salipaludibacillus agaradhaerens]|uniref:LysR family transcriptional regulator n=1 Tax=Salipaludibacillus agaradhaerens TaxID=76935 RepID=UPI0021514813|nr:LysR family transcriptional regulator [Salipaludibacillus agaradhaerens]MCR6107767.1 LysR family transcriptional regulator [Salipaludibacillus agaradhaerens]MCR6119796.1 LysR family transcriptional regulator [Salipaludibacillus agaradhaerens]